MWYLAMGAGQCPPKVVGFNSFRECCSRCGFQPYDCVIIRFMEEIQSAFKFCQWPHVDNVAHGLSLATIARR